MPPIVTDPVAWSVGRSVTYREPCKTAKAIKMSLALRLGWA